MDFFFLISVNTNYLLINYCQKLLKANKSLVMRKCHNLNLTAVELLGVEVQVCVNNIRYRG